VQDQFEALTLAKHGLSQEDIAQKLGFSKSAICQCLKRWHDMSELAQAYIRAHAIHVARKQVNCITEAKPSKETYDMATDFLERAGAINPKPQPNPNPSTAVQVNVGAISGYHPDE